MSLLLHTDIGHDPDDVIALAFLIESGYAPDSIVVTPGFSYQRKIVNGILESYGVKCDRFVADPDKEDKPDNSNKNKMLYCNKERQPIFGPPHMHFVDESLIIGPPISLGDNLVCKKMTFQGGYSPNSIKPLEKFEGRHSVASFNPNGAKYDFNKLLSSGEIGQKYYVGKNVCHGFTKEDLSFYWKPENKLIRRFFDELKPTKAMHDVLAAMMLIDKDFGIWEQAQPVWDKRRLTTTPTTKQIWTLIGVNENYGETK